MNNPATLGLMPEGSRVDVAFLDAQGSPLDTHTFDLVNTKAAQVFDVAAAGVSAFTLKVLEVYPSGQGSGVAIAEIEFQARN